MHSLSGMSLKINGLVNSAGTGGYPRHHIWWASVKTYWWRLQKMVVRPFNAELCHSIAQRIGMQMEDFCGTIGSFDHSRC